MELCGHECVGFCEFDKFAVMSYTSMHLITEEQRAYLATLDLKARQKEILKEEYRNGEWYASDVRRVYAGDIPDADCWCFGFPCQDISVAGKQLGFTGNRSSLFFRIMYLLGQLEEEKRPTYLFIENVANLLSVNGGWDFARLLTEMDKGGYDAEWQVLNSKYFGVPHNRERCFIIGHLRGRSTAEVFPVEGADAADSVYGVNQIELDGRSNRINPNQYRVYDPDGISPCLNQMGGGGREPHIIDPKYYKLEGGVRVYENCTPTLTSRDYKDPLMVTQDVGINPTLRSDRYGLKAAVKVKPGETSCNQGIFVQVSEDLMVYAVWYPKKQCYIAIRKLTPKECFRLQGWTDDYFEKAEFVNSNSQLYKQAGNGVTVNVIEAIARKMK